jgi:hypothetical protein
LVKLKMYLLLLPEATGAAIMSKFTHWWVFEQTNEEVSKLGEFRQILVLTSFTISKKLFNVLVHTRPPEYFLVRLNLVLATPSCPSKCPIFIL